MDLKNILNYTKHVQLRKETRALHDNLWLATAGGNQGKYTETRNKLEGKRQTDNTKKK